MSAYDWCVLALGLMVLISIARKSVLFTLGLAIFTTSVIVGVYAPLFWFGYDPFIAGLILTAIVGACLTFSSSRSMR